MNEQSAESTDSSESTESSEVLYEVVDHVATITLNAPQRMNTISGPMLQAISQRLLEADADPDARCVVLTGAGRAFCAGLDLAAQSSARPGSLGNLGSATAGAGEFDLRDAPPIVLHELDTPTVCVLNGGAAGYGLDLALGCDIRIAAASAKLNPGFAKRGILPESGGTWLMPRIVGYARAAEWLFSSRVVLSEEAQTMGLVHAVHPPEAVLQATLAYARTLVDEAAPSSLRTIKRQLTLDLFRPLAESAHESDRLIQEMIGSEEYRHGVKALIEKRPPGFAARYTADPNSP